MQSTERQKFEDEFKSAFEGAEMTPSDSVWNSIELDLAAQENVVMKKRVVFYQRLAAATVLFALLAGVYAFYTKTEDGKLLTKRGTELPPKSPSDGDNELTPNNDDERSKEQGVRSKESVVTTDTHTASTGEETQKTEDRIQKTGDGIEKTEEGSPKEERIQNETVNDKYVASNDQLKNDHGANTTSGSKTVGTTTAAGNQFQKSVKNKQSLSEFYNQIALSDNKSDNNAAFVGETPKETLVVAGNDNSTTDNNTQASGQQEVVSPLQQKKEEAVALVLPAEEDVIVVQKDKKREKESLWVAVGGAAGNFSPNTVASTPSATASFAADKSSSFGVADNRTQLKNEREKKGVAYSVGLSVGKKLGRRVVIQSGLALVNQQVDYTSNYTTLSASNTQQPSLIEYANLAPSAASVMAAPSEYQINSTLEMLSIPLQAGYLIVDRRLGWQVNAGVSSDIFLKNTLVDKSGQSERFTQSAGTESPYRSLNWSGLASTEVSYRLGTHYRLSLVPGVRYSFKPLLKDGANSGTPVVMDLGFRFNYIFK